MLTTGRFAGLKALFWEFFRYGIVGGVAFWADFGTLVGGQGLGREGFAGGLNVSTVAGFVVGLVVNYALSLGFVFTAAKDRGKGRSAGAFAVFGMIGALGLVWTELGMWLGVAVLGWNYQVVKVLVTGAVLVWNYAGRKVLIFR